MNAISLKPELKSRRSHRHHLPMAALSVDLHDDGKQAFVACLDGVYQLHLKTGAAALLHQHDSYASGVAHFPQNQTLISAAYDGTLRWFDLAKAAVTRTVPAHSFWSWNLAKHSGEQRALVASCSGQYLAGDYAYLPQTSDAATIKLYDAIAGDLLSEFRLTPPVHCVAISPDGNLIAAGNLMGDVAVWKVDGSEIARWNTPDFTAFGIVKSHCQIGGLHAIAFTPDSQQVVVAGMGPMHDPMAGNGKQRWQRFAWSAETPQKLAASKDDQVGEGLMETLCFHPDGQSFVMAGRLRGGAWSTGWFDLASGDLIHSIKSESRVTCARFNADGSRLILAGAINQSADPNHKFGVVDVYKISR